MTSYKNKLVTFFSLSLLALVVIVGLPQPVAALSLGNSLEVRANIKEKNEIKVKTENKNSVEATTTEEVSTTTDSDGDFDYKNDDNLPPGIKTAPGIEKRVETGKWLPQGLLKFFDRSESNDASVNIRLNGFEVETATSSASIYFKTNIDTKGVLTYSASSSLSDATVIDLALADEHNITLSDLEAGTVYYFQIKLETASGEASYDSRVRTLATIEIDTDFPEINFFHIFSVKENSANVIWITTEKTTGKVWVSATSSVDTTVTPTFENTDSSYFHVFDLADLEADTDYYVKVSSTDGADNTTFSEVLSFTTDTE